MSKMTEQYEDYILEHVNNVQRAYYWLLGAFPDLFMDMDVDAMTEAIESHDTSKWGTLEFYPYAEYFYGNNRNSDKVKEEFNFAWLHHQHRNTHHWQFWVLINDDEGIVPLPMDDIALIEMICDHWSFSWKTGNLYEIFDWYEKHKDKMILHDNTRAKYENILDRIKEKLGDNSDAYGS